MLRELPATFLIAFALGCQAPGPGADVSFLPGMIYPDSVLSTAPDGATEGVVWFVNGQQRATGARVMGADLGLVAGDEVSVGRDGDVSGSAARSVLAHPDLLVTEAMGNSVARVHGCKLEVTETIALPVEGFSMPIALAISADGQDVWATSHIDGKVWELGRDPWRTTASTHAGDKVYWLALDESRQRLLVADQGASALIPIALDGLVAGKPIGLPAPPVSVRIHGDRAWIACRTGGSPMESSGDEPRNGWLVTVDLTTDHMRQVDLGGAPYWAEPTPDGKTVAVADQAGRRILLVEAGDLSVKREIEVPGGPTGLAWSPDASRLYVALYTEALVIEMDPASGELLRQWKGGKGTVGVFPRADGRFLFVPVLHENRIMVVDTLGDDETFSIEGLRGPRAVALVPRN